MSDDLFDAPGLFDPAPKPKRERPRLPPVAPPAPTTAVTGVKGKQWTPNDGKRPVAASTSIYARIRVLSRSDAEAKGANPASYWTRWTLDGGPGDIVEWRRA